MAWTITHSLLDRLIDDDPDSAADRHESEEEAVARYKVALRRDLESLLNTTRPWLPVIAGHPGLERTIVAYGMPDLSTEDMSIAAVRERVRRVIAQAIREHEPRLSEIDIEMDQGPTSTGLRLRIAAVLSIMQSDEAVIYEASVRPGDRAIEVKLTA